MAHHFPKIQYSLIAVTLVIVLLSFLTNNIRAGSYSWLAVAILLLMNGLMSFYRKHRAEGFIYLLTATAFTFLFIRF